MLYSKLFRFGKRATMCVNSQTSLKTCQDVSIYGPNRLDRHFLFGDMASQLLMLQKTEVGIPTMTASGTPSGNESAVVMVEE